MERYTVEGVRSKPSTCSLGTSNQPPTRTFAKRDPSHQHDGKKPTKPTNQERKGTDLGKTTDAVRPQAVKVHSRENEDEEGDRGQSLGRFGDIETRSGECTDHGWGFEVGR